MKNSTRQALFLIFIALLILKIIELLIMVCPASAEELTIEEEPLSYGYVIRDSGGRVIYTVGRDWFDDDVEAAVCLDGGSVEECTIVTGKP